jgi:hypothetical protein
MSIINPQEAVGLHKPVSVAFDCEDDFMFYKDGKCDGWYPHAHC